MKPDVKELHTAANKARTHSYSPYSRFAVGSALRTSSGKIYSGCNVENSSYGAAMCAERVAIHKAISEEGKTEIKEILVITDTNPPAPPCGMCRQVLSEFGKNAIIHYTNTRGDVVTTTLGQLLPHAFSPDSLPK